MVAGCLKYDCTLSSRTQCHMCLPLKTVEHEIEVIHTFLWMDFSHGTCVMCTFEVRDIDPENYAMYKPFN